MHLHPYLIETRGPDPVRARVDLPEQGRRPCPSALSAAVTRLGTPAGRVLRLLTLTSDRSGTRATFTAPGSAQVTLTLTGPAAHALQFTVPSGAA